MQQSQIFSSSSCDLVKMLENERRTLCPAVEGSNREDSSFRASQKGSVAFVVPVECVKASVTWANFDMKLFNTLFAYFVIASVSCLEIRDGQHSQMLAHTEWTSARHTIITYEDAW